MMGRSKNASNNSYLCKMGVSRWGDSRMHLIALTFARCGVSRWGDSRTHLITYFCKMGGFDKFNFGNCFPRFFCCDPMPRSLLLHTIFCQFFSLKNSFFFSRIAFLFFTRGLQIHPTSQPAGEAIQKGIRLRGDDFVT